VLRRSIRDVWRSTWPIFLCCLPPIIAARFIQHHLSDVPIWQRALIAMDTLSFYTIKIVWPTRLVPDYNRSPQVALRSQWLWACWIIPLVALAILILVRRSRPAVV